MAWIKVGMGFVNSDNISRIEDSREGIIVYFTASSGDQSGNHTVDFARYRGDEAAQLVNAIRRLAEAGSAP